MAAPPAARAALSLALALLLLLALALFVVIGSASSAAALSASRPSVAAPPGSSASSSDLPRGGAAARLQRAHVGVLAIPASPVRGHVVALAIGAARRRLLTYPGDFVEAHGAGDPLPAAAPAAPPAGADWCRGVSLSPRAASTGAGAGAAVSSDETRAVTVCNDDAEANRTPLHAARLRPTTPASAVLALPAASPGPQEADDPVASPAAAAPPPASDTRSEVPPPPRTTTCSFVTYIGAGSGAAEMVERGDARVFVVKEFTRATNSTEPTEDYFMDSDDDTDDVDTDAFAPAMARFCAFVDYISDTFDVVKAFA